MPKLFLPLTFILLSLPLSIFAQETATTPLKVKGFYAGLGGGSSLNLSVTSVGRYQDNTSIYNTDSLSDSDVGYLIYAGYQFNKIIAIEAAFTDYGTFSDTATRTITKEPVLFKRSPQSYSVYANAGYTFSNGLRPFGQLGLAYLLVNPNENTKNIGLHDTSAIHFGLGLEYAPAKLAGFGFRVAFTEETAMDYSYKSASNGQNTSALLMSVNALVYLGAQYKF